MGLVELNVPEETPSLRGRVWLESNELSQRKVILSRVGTGLSVEM